MGKYNFDLLNTFCNENNIKLLEDYKNSYLKHNSKIYIPFKPETLYIALYNLFY